MFDFIDFMNNGGYIRGYLERKAQESTGKTITTKIDDYVIDSLYTFDNGFETAIKKGNSNWAVAESYKTREEMEKGHKKWCEICKNEAPTKLYDSYMEREVNFEVEEDV